MMSGDGGPPLLSLLVGLQFAWLGAETPCVRGNYLSAFVLGRAIKSRRVLSISFPILSLYLFPFP
jgi:hypothetical protein